jgi:hypothetical protein
MKYLETAYNAASILTDLQDVAERETATIISSVTSIIQADLESLPHGLLRHDSEAQRRIQAVIDYGFYISAKAHRRMDVSNDRSNLFRCVSDLQSDMNDEERFEWNFGAGHWVDAQNADAEYSKLMNEEAA